MSTGTNSTNRLAPVALTAIVVLLLFLLQFGWPSGAAAAGPYEPNDVSTSAYGPLGSGQALTAAIETSSDRDFFYFYATAAAASPVSLTVHSLGGNNRAASGINASLLNAAGTPLTSLSFIYDGEVRTATANLEPQKYFVEVSASEGSGDSYELAVSGAPGVVGPFSQITAQCAAAEAGVERGQSGVSRAEGKLQRVIARLRRSQYGGAKGRSSARAALRKARAGVSGKRDGLRKARAARQPWCSIAP